MATFGSLQMPFLHELGFRMGRGCLQAAVFLQKPGFKASGIGPGETSGIAVSSESSLLRPEGCTRGKGKQKRHVPSETHEVTKKNVCLPKINT
jgi:hypothetical protein